MQKKRLKPKIQGVLLLISLEMVLGVWRTCDAATPDVRSVDADLQVPPAMEAEPTAGNRVFQRFKDWGQVHHTLYLPSDWQPERKYPVIVESPGNGGFRSRFGDVCTGMPEGCKIGYGASGGKGFIWLCVPFVADDRVSIAKTWWGSQPKHDVQPTIDYWTQATQDVCDRFGGDRSRVILAGFSRGAIACNRIGLADPEIAKLWRGFIVYSHYDGVRQWRLPGDDRDSAMVRLQRLGSRPQFICQEQANEQSQALKATESYLREALPEGNFTFVATGFRNHSDAWTLRPSEARDQLRRWLHRVAAPLD